MTHNSKGFQAKHTSSTSLCAHLFAQHGNALEITTAGFKTGHEPVHTSKSGGCVTIDATKDAWYCRPCSMGGGLVQALMSLEGLSLVEAQAQAVVMGAEIRHPKGKPLAQSQAAAGLAAQYRDQWAYDGATQRWYVYGEAVPGIWSPVDPDAPEESALARIKEALVALCPEGFTAAYCKGVAWLLQLDLLTHFPVCPPTHLPVLNGRLNLETLQREDYTPGHYHTWCVPYRWDSQATCPATLAWLKEATCNDQGMISVLRAYLKAILLGRVDLQKFLELIGPGGSGKGTFARLATALIGVRNTYSTELRRLEHSRFETANLRGKRLICITDAERFAGEVDVLKALTGGDRLPFEEKHKQGRNGMAEGLVLIAANEAIMSADYTSGLARRRITMPFLHQPPTQRDLLTLTGEQVSGSLAAELPGVLRWVLALPDARMEALLLATTTEVTSLKTAQAENLVRINPLALWADGHVLYDPRPDPVSGEWCKTYVGVARRYTPKESPATYDNLDTWLYASYRGFTEAVNNKPIAMQRFSDILADLCINQLRLKGVAHSRDMNGAYFRGLRLRPEDDTSTARLITTDAPTPPHHDGSDPHYDEGMTDYDEGMTEETRVDDGYDGYDEGMHTRVYETDGVPPNAREVGRAREGSPCVQSRSCKSPSYPSYPSSSEENQTLSPSCLHHNLSGAPSYPSPPLAEESGAARAREEVNDARALREPAPLITVGATLDLPKMEYVTTAAQLAEVLPDLLNARRIGLDTETTGLDWQTHRLRLLQFATPTEVILVDAFQCPLPALRPLFESPVEFVGHNLKFDLHMAAAAGLPWPAHLLDTMLLAQLLGASAEKGKRPSYRLEDVVERMLDRTLDKTLQTSAWDGPLSLEQLHYAARDAAILLPLAEALMTGVQAAGLERTAQVEHACLPAVVWMEQAGVPVDTTRWLDLAHLHTHTTAKYEAELSAALTQAGPGVHGLVAQAVNWRSPTQVLEVLAARGHQVPNTAAETLAPLADTDPLVALLLAYREAGIRARTFGDAWLSQHLHPLSGRVHADYFQLGSTAGRLSCGHPNMQNIPRTSAYRRCFRAADGACLLKADYSHIELRIAAVLANDTTLLTAFQAGADVHSLTAARLLGLPLEAVTEDHRQLAKVVNFGLLYGMGAPRLQEHAQKSYRVTLTADEANAHRRAFFELYQGLRAWHRTTGDTLQQAGCIETRTMAGRRRLHVGKFTEALNTPVQGTGADGLKAALARLWTHRQEVPEAQLIACIHDEVVVECPIAQQAETTAWLQRHMRTAMQEIVQDLVPIEVKTTVGHDWAGTPLE